MKRIRKYFGEFYSTTSNFKSKEIAQELKFSTKDCMYILSIVSIIFVSLFVLWR